METTTTLQDLAKRAVKCRKTWVWRENMRKDNSVVTLDVRLPDFKDAITVKELLAVVREVWRNPLLAVSAVVSADHPVAFKVIVNYDGLSFTGESEVEALVKALEAADAGRVL